MNCPKCGGAMVALFYTQACNYCDPPGGPVRKVEPAYQPNRSKQARGWVYWPTHFGSESSLYTHACIYVFETQSLAKSRSYAIYDSDVREVYLNQESVDWLIHGSEIVAKLVDNDQNEEHWHVRGHRVARFVDSV